MHYVGLVLLLSKDINLHSFFTFFQNNCLAVAFLDLGNYWNLLLLEGSSLSLCIWEYLLLLLELNGNSQMQYNLGYCTMLLDFIYVEAFISCLLIKMIP